MATADSAPKNRTTDNIQSRPTSPFLTTFSLNLLKIAPRNGINPFDYLTDVLTRIAAYSHAKRGALLPHRCKAAREAAHSLASVA